MSAIEPLLQAMLACGASDLHLTSSQLPRVRVNGEIRPLQGRPLTEAELYFLLEEILPESQRASFAGNTSTDFAYASGAHGRFRVNAYRHVHGLALAVRAIPGRVPSLGDLGLPTIVQQHLSFTMGLTLVTGPTGSGKSTTLAAMIDHINSTRRGHIITLEEPIEYVHTPKKCVITQREIGTHAASFGEALRDAVREDPDVILVGELRDADAIAMALSAAETGIQVLGTLHTSGATRTVDRMINVFPAGRQEQVRAMLAESLNLIVSQRLVRALDGSRRHAAVEVLLNTAAVRANIRAGSSHKIASVMQTSRAVGMQSLDTTLKELAQLGHISWDDAYEHAIEKTAFEQRLARSAPV